MSFPISCNPAVQKPFERGVALLHSFWYLESVKAFTAVTQADPDCAMGYWGTAMSYALALQATAEPHDKTYARQKKSAELAEKVMAVEPDHPGAAHYRSSHAAIRRPP